MRKKLLYTAGFITICFAMLHLSFWSMLNWELELATLNSDNRGILQMLNVGSIYMLLFFALISFHLAPKKELSFTEKASIVFIAGYYVLRIAFGIPFFTMSVEELVIWIFCLVVAACYLFSLKQQKKLAG